jgi:hypothetical protein
LETNIDNYILKRDRKGVPNDRVLDQLLVVFKTDELGLSENVVFGEAKVNTSYTWVNNKNA